MHLLAAQSGEIVDGSEAVDLGQSPGDIVFIPANTPHSSVVIGNEDLIFVTAKDTSWGIVGIKKKTPSKKK